MPYLCFYMKQDLHRVVGLILDENINVILPPDEEPALVDYESYEVFFFQHKL